MVLSTPAAVASDFIAGDQAVVSGTEGSGLNVRSAPTADSEVHLIADEGTVVEVISGPEEVDGVSWYEVSIDGHGAWVVAEYLDAVVSEGEPEPDGAASEVEPAPEEVQPGEVAPEEVQPEMQVQVVNTDGHGLRLRAEASSAADTVTVLSEGAILAVVGDDQIDEAGMTWSHVQYNGTPGYAYNGYLAGVSDGEGHAVAENPAEPEPPAEEEQHEEEHAEEPVEEEAPEEVEEPEPAPDPEPAPEEPGDPGAIAVGGNAQIVNTGGAGLNIRHGAGGGHGVLAVAGEGDVVQVIGGPETDAEGASWWNVDYRGSNGWAHGDYLQATDAEPTGEGSSVGAASPDIDDNGDDADNDGNEAPPSSSMGEQLAAEAMQFLGYPYVWGGTSPSGFDCSGFIYYVVSQVTGEDFPRVMEAQVNRGTYVPADQLQPGDIVFQQNTYQWGLSHAGIYIGGGQFIHASTPGSGVIISDLWDSYWGQRYYTARRIS